MKKILLLAMTMCCGVIYGQVFITEIADPNNDATARYVELYNSGVSSVDLSSWKINRYTNDSATPQTPVALTGSIAAGGFYIIAANSSGFSNAFGFSADQVIGTGGPADSNGDDQIFLLDDLDAVVDIFGVPGEDGTGTCHEFEDGRAERAASVTSGNSGTFDESEWNVWADSPITGCTNHTNEAQDSPSGFDPGEWIGAPSTDTKVSFSASSGSISETGGTFDLVFLIENESASSATSFDVELTSGSASDVNSFTTQMVTFPANSSSNQTITLTITDDSDVEFDETLTFSITNVSGGESASAASPFSFDLTIEDDDAGGVLISEIVYNTASTDDEWIEIYNGSGSSVDVSNWTIEVGGTLEFTFPGSTSLANGSYTTVALGSNGDGTFNNDNSFTPDFARSAISADVANTNSTNVLANDAQSITLKTAGGGTVNEVTYDDGDDSRTDGGGPSYEIIDLTADNSTTASNWQASAVDGGSPGAFSSVTVWDGNTNDEWGNAANWSNGVPDEFTNAIISTGSNFPTVDDDQAVNDLTINSGQIVLVNSGGGIAIYDRVTNNGSYSIDRNSVGSGGYSILSSPVTSINISDLSDADYAYSFDGTNYSANLSGTATNMNDGQGYFIGSDAANPTMTFFGTPNTGTSTYGVTTGNFELVGNPYSAAISISDFLADNAGTINAAVYFWDDGGSNVGGNRGGDYITTNGMGTASAVEPNGVSDGVSGGQGTSGAENGYITSGQGFYVEAAADANVVFTQDMQVSTSGANSDGNHYRKQEYQKVKLSISGGGLYNEVLIGLGEDATLGRDSHLDAKKFVSGSALSFYSMIGEDKYVIQGLPLATSEIVSTKLGFDAKAGTFEMKVIDLENIPENMSLTLIDHTTGISYDLRKTESFTFTSADVKNDQRFELQFSPNEILSVDGLTKGLSIYGNTSELTIASETEGSQKVSIYSLDGKVAFDEVVNFSNNKAVINPSLTHNKVYMLRVGEQSFKFMIQ